MKPWLRFLIVVALFGAFMLLVRFSRAAQGPRLAGTPVRLLSLVAQPIIDMNGTLVAFQVTAAYHAVEFLPNGTTESKQVGTIQFDLKQTNGMIVVDGVAMDDAEVVDGLMEITAREWRKSHPEALPQRRKALRSK